MKIELLSNEIFNFNCLSLENKPIGIFQGLFFISKEEREHVIQIANMIWRKILKKSRVKNFLGYIRFDFVPKVNEISKIGKRIFEIDFEIVGIYEVNVHSPECACAITALHKAIPKLKMLQPNPAYLISKAIKKTFNDTITIIFVPGKGTVKKCFSYYFYDELSKFLDIRWMSEEEAMKFSKSEILWRWGDARINGPSEYSPKFLRFLLELESKGIVFNTVPIYEDLGNKIYLMPDDDKEWNKLVGKNFLLNLENLEIAIKNREKLVLKPLTGSSGNEIIFGINVSQDQWEKILKEKLRLGYGLYGLFEARWLPSIEIDEKNKIVFDFNSTFWAVNEKLDYLYSVIRVDELKRYNKRLVINVTQGGGFAGACCEEE